MTPSGIEPTTFRLVVQCLDQLCYVVPLVVVVVVVAAEVAVAATVAIILIVLAILVVIVGSKKALKM